MEAPTNRVAISICLILGVLMQALDTTIANVALPYMQGSVSASQDEIAWVLTSYIVAAAIMTPPTGFLAGRFGVKRLYVISIAGFTIASMLCGAAQSLAQIVVFRVLQGMFGAALVPLAQSVMFNIMPQKNRGSGMAIFGIAVMVGPVLGPVLGGWLTANFSWRYVFYVNLPFGLMAFFGSLVFLPKTTSFSLNKLDWFGFAMLSLAIGALQVLLDRGEVKDWFSSTEIIVETVVAAVAFYLFLVQTFTARAPFLNPGLFRDRNFTAGVIFAGIVGLTYYSALALQPPYLQGLMGYPVTTAGLVMGPRGVGTMVAMLLVGRLVNVVDIRYLLGVGIVFSAISFFEMTYWTPDISQFTIASVGLLQGFGLGFIFVPLSTVTLSTITADSRAEGAGMYNLARNIGSSAGISIVNTLLTRNTQVAHADIAAFVTPFNRNLMAQGVSRFWSPATTTTATTLDSVIGLQAQIIAYDDVYKFLMLAMLASFPLLMVFKRQDASGSRAGPVAATKESTEAG